ncbi:MIF4G/MA4 domain-containing protein [Coprinopsis cinerea AmutBmut pab1-1]|nr:MIF4G/MA4 domain-containing protein [Coprinopsis cinerea AmutBmut pab1-1]
MKKGKKTGIRLPESLQDQINERESDDRHYHRGVGRNKNLSRKELRKQERASKKQKRAEYFSHSRPSVQEAHPGKRPAEESAESPIRKRPRKDNALDEKLSTEVVAENPVQPSNEKQSKGSSSSSHKPAKKPVSVPPKPKSQIEENEDRYIRFLEKQLGYSKGKPKKKSADEDDGLDDLLDFADNLTMSLGEGGNEGDFDDEDNFSEGSDTLDDYDMDAEEGGSEDSEDDGLEDEEEEEEWGGIESDSGSTESEAEESSEAGKAGKAAETTTKPAAGSVYVPPHLRKAPATQSEALLKLTRQLKGLLNRMSEQNIGSIVGSIEDIYRDNSRNDVTSTLTNLVIEGVASHSVLLDSYVVLHAAFVSSLHKLVGIEFAAHFVQQVVSNYEKYYEALSTPSSSDAPQQEDDDKGKECSNLIVLLSELYNFQVISSILMFDIIRALLKDEISEFNVELLLKILRNSGQQLRADDPLALKDIVQIVQDKVEGKESAVSSRTRFMIETLTNLKNNKIKKLGEQNQGGAAVERMKKFLAGLSKTKHVLAHEPLRISLEDLHSANTKGKWWLVGAAWGGDPLVDRQAHMEEIAATQKAARDEESSLLKLARKQGMNSDIRRSIFVVLMSSEDYVDACDRLSQLNLTEVQQREIVRVLLHCCGNEKSYNPYYALVCEQLCKKSHSYKITVQFCLWDFLRDLGETKVGGAELVKNATDDGFDVKSISRTRMNNVARCYAWWVAKDAVSLSILKPVDFTMLKPQTRGFLKEFLTHLLLNSQLTTPVVTNDLGSVAATLPTRNRGAVEEIFIKASRIDTVAMGLVYFMNEAFKEEVKKGKAEKESREGGKEDKLRSFLVWGVELAKDTLQTGLDVIPDL